MSDEVESLRKQFEQYRDMSKKEIEAQAKAIRKLQNDVNGLRKYVNNLMKKAENFIGNKLAALRKTQVIDRQKLNDLNSEIDRIVRNIK